MLWEMLMSDMSITEATVCIQPRINLLLCGQRLWFLFLWTSLSRLGFHKHKSYGCHIPNISAPSTPPLCSISATLLRAFLRAIPCWLYETAKQGMSQSLRPTERLRLSCCARVCTRVCGRVRTRADVCGRVRTCYRNTLYTSPYYRHV